jgi:hypothetical protein
MDIFIVSGNSLSIQTARGSSTYILMSSRSPYSLLQIHKHFLKDFERENNKTNYAKHEISKWRPNSRWTVKRFYRLKLVYLIIF